MHKLCSLDAMTLHCVAFVSHFYQFILTTFNTSYNKYLNTALLKKIMCFGQHTLYFGRQSNVPPAKMASMLKSLATIDDY